MVQCSHFTCWSCMTHGSKLYHDLQSVGTWWKIEVRENGAWVDPSGEEMVEPSRAEAEASARMLLVDGAVEVRILTVTAQVFMLGDT